MAEATAPKIDLEIAARILKIKAQVLQECAEQVMLDRSDLYRKWTAEARELRIMAGETPEDESGDS